MDARPRDAAGRGAVRSRTELVSASSRKGRRDSLPAAIVIPETRGVDSYKDITPRAGAAIDLFGTGRTALKVSAGKYLEGAGVSGIYANTNPSLRMPQTTTVFGTAGVTRAWTDVERQLRARLRSAESGCAGSARRRRRCLRRDVEHELRPGRPDEQLRLRRSSTAGACVRRTGISSVAVQHQVLPRASVDVAYIRRWYRGFFAADNLRSRAFRPDAVQHRRAAGSAPARRRRLRRRRASTTSFPKNPARWTTSSPTPADYGGWHQRFDGVDVTVNVRAGGFTSRAEPAPGQTVADNCEVRGRLPELVDGDDGDERVRRRPRQFGGDPAQPLLPRRLRRPDPVQGLVDVPRPARGDPVVGRRSEQARGDARRQLRRAQRRRRAVARQEPLGERAERHGEPGRARDDVRRSDQPARLPRCRRS